MTDPTYQRLRVLIDGYQYSALIHVAARLGLAEQLAGKSATACELAGRLQVDTSALTRLLRGLVLLDVVREEADDHFALTETGQALRPGQPGSLHESAVIAGAEYLPAWGQLLHSVRTGETAFNQVFGQTPWEHRAAHPELDAAFNGWLREQTGGFAAAVTTVCDFSRAGRIMDVGGGLGGLLTAILTANPHLSGVLFDQPHVTSTAQAWIADAGLADRCDTVGGDFFDTIPPGADVYLLKSVLHDWDDFQAETLLRTCRQAMRPGARLLLIERLLPRRAGDDPTAIMLDLHMLAVPGGRERDAEAYRRIAAAAGLNWIRTTPTSVGMSILEFQISGI
jgi:SAM-dependent methyltransferase